MTIDTNELRKLTQSATPGPWKILPVGDGRQKFAVADRKSLSILTVTDEGEATFGTVYDDADAKFIAAANPATINDLLDRLEAAESARRDDYQNWMTALDRNAELLAKLEAAEKERDELLAGFDEWLDKTKWVQQGVNEGMISAKYLGLHRADVMTSLLGEAEKERDALRAAVRHEADCVEACKSEIDRLRAENAGLVDDMNLLRDNNTALRARIEAMEKQEPMGTLHDDGCFVWRETAPHESNYAGWKMALYALPGAQPAPSTSPAALRPVIQWLRNGCDPAKAADELEMLAPSVPDGVAEALQRLIENGAVLGPASSEDALLVARYRQLLLACSPSVPDGWQLVPTAESRHPGIYKMLGALHAADNTPGASEWESYAAFLAAAPEAKP